MSFYGGTKEYDASCYSLPRAREEHTDVFQSIVRRAAGRTASKISRPSSKEKETRFGVDGRRYSRAEFEKHFGDDGLREWESAPTTIGTWRERHLQKQRGNQLKMSLQGRKKKQQKAAAQAAATSGEETLGEGHTSGVPPQDGNAVVKLPLLRETVGVRPPSPSAAPSGERDGRSFFAAASASTSLRPPSPDDIPHGDAAGDAPPQGFELMLPAASLAGNHHYGSTDKTLYTRTEFSAKS